MPPNLNDNELSKNDKRHYNISKVEWWKYDDGSIGSIEKRKASTSKGNKKKKYISVYYKNKAIFNRKMDSENIKSKIKRVFPTYGVHVLSSQADNYTNKLNNKHFDEFCKMTQIGANNEECRPLLELVALILSSYVIKGIVKIRDEIVFYLLDEYELHALAAMIPASENSIYFLRELCRTLIVDTTDYQDYTGAHCAPSVIPEKPHCTVAQSAYFASTDKAKRLAFAPYGETAVLIDMRGFSKSDRRDVRDFCQKNPWCSPIVYYAGNKVDLQFRYTVYIKRDSLSCLEVNWKRKRVHKLVCGFASTIEYLFKHQKRIVKSEWRRAGQCLDAYLQSKGDEIKSYPDRFRYRVMFTSMFLFLDFVQGTCKVKRSRTNDFRIRFANIMLPGSYHLEEDGIEIERSSIDYQELFESFLRTILTTENLTHFCASKLGDKESTPRKKDGIELWGYYRKFDWDKKGKSGNASSDSKNTDCLVLFEDTAKKLLGKIQPDTNGSELLESLRCFDLPYIHGSPRQKVKFEGEQKSKSRNALRLRIDRLPIEDDVRQSMISYIKANGNTD